MDDVIDSFFTEDDLVFTNAAIPANLKLLDGLIRGSNYENQGLLIKGCKLYGMYALGFMEDASADASQDRDNMKRAKDFYGRAKDYGLKALSANPDFKRVEDGNLEDFRKVLDVFKKDDVEALFWTAFAWGSYINLNRTSVSDIADLPKVKAMIDRVIELDGSYFYGIPHLFLIVYYSMPRMFGGDPDIAQKEYARVKEISGGKFIMADFYMAKYYSVQAQDRDTFRRMLTNVNNADDNIIDEKLFTLVAKKKAAVLLQKENDLF
jgi:hypothetical protein